MSAISYKSKTGFQKITVIVLILAFGLAMLLWAVSAFPDKEKANADKEISDKKTLLQPKDEISTEQPISIDDEEKYMTFTQEGNISIIVKYLSPLSEDKNSLAFEVSLDTHSVDLTKYKDISKYVKLGVDPGGVVREGFEWDLEDNDGHHISGILKIKNNIAGNPIVGPDTKTLKLIFKDIGAMGEREHVYEGDMLK